MGVLCAAAANDGSEDNEKMINAKINSASVGREARRDRHMGCVLSGSGPCYGRANGEVKSFGDKFVMKQMGRGFVKVGAEKPDPEDVRLVEEAWNEAQTAINSGQWDLVILDEINYAISYSMLDAKKVAEALKAKPEMV